MDEEERTAFQEKIERYNNEGRPIIYLDESGFENDMPRTRGYSKKGKRCFGKHDWHSKGRVNAIGAIIGFVFLTIGLFNCNINSDVFYAWLKIDLLPKVELGSVIVMDNATFHKRLDMIEAIEEHGCIVEFLPAYSPDLNPIEHKWAQAKSIRKSRHCSVDELFSNYANL